MRVLISMACLLIGLSFIGGCVTTPSCPPCPSERMMMWYPDGSCPMTIPKGHFDDDEWEAGDEALENLFDRFLEELSEPEEEGTKI